MNIPENIEAILDSVNEGVLIVDREGRILFYNKAYENSTGVRLQDMRYQNLRVIRPRAGIYEVMQTGVPQFSASRKENNVEYFSNIYPIYQNQKVVGGISIVTYLKEATYLSNKLKEINEERQFLKKRIQANNGTRYTFDHIIAEDELSLKTLQMAKKIAPSDINVLLEGESGCGKEVYAQSIHNASSRKEHPFIAVNCATLTSTMLESDLFGYEEGAFTGAKKGGKIGLFEAAQHGTLFLDEISEIDYALQSKLLRALQEQKIRRIGGVKEIDVDVRLICASNVNLEKLMEKGLFRSDIYYRIAVFDIKIPPLRERRGDIAPLLSYYLGQLGLKKHQHLTLSPLAHEALCAYLWPGNVREMKNVLEFCSLMAVDGQISEEALPVPIAQYLPPRVTDSKMTLADKIRVLETEEINKAIIKFGNSVAGKKAAAKYLGISLANLYKKLPDIPQNFLYARNFQK